MSPAVLPVLHLHSPVRAAELLRQPAAHCRNVRGSELSAAPTARTCFLSPSPPSKETLQGQLENQKKKKKHPIHSLKDNVNQILGKSYYLDHLISFSSSVNFEHKAVIAISMGESSAVD